jgi:hypothetical protein
MENNNWQLAGILRALILFAVIGAGIFLDAPVSIAQEQDETTPRVQILHGRIDPDTDTIYRLFGMRAGEKLYVRMVNVSGNLDPLLILLDGSADLDELSVAVGEELGIAIAEGRDPLVTIPSILDRYAQAWNDDYGDQHDAAFEFTIPEDGSYQLLVGGAPGISTFGEYRVWIGVNAPEVLSGEAISTGDTLALLDESATERGVSVKEIRDVISPESPSLSYTLRNLNPGETVFAYAESTSEDIAPVLVLRNFSGKPLRSSNTAGLNSFASIEYPVERDVSDYKLTIESYPLDSETPAGDFRLLVGVNAPDVLTGIAQPQGGSPFKEPIEVRIGSKLQQITNIDQQSEKFSAVAELRMEWQDPELAFNPDSCDCAFRTYTGDSFSRFADDNEILWPEFTLLNQQGNRWVQNRDVVVFTDGRAIYQERYTTDFQAPLFNFTQFPFDQQQLYIQAVSIPPDSYFTYSDPQELSEIGDKLGEEEWFIIDSDTQVTTEDEQASFWLNFTVTRHIEFYLYRILIPIALVILVSWITFFLKDYGKRVDVAGANLLLFVAFNFTISGELPRLGYLTFMDAILIGTFIVTVFVVIFNVVLKRLEVTGRVELAHRIDKPAIWIYPLLYAIGGLVAYLMFFT